MGAAGGEPIGPDEARASLSRLCGGASGLLLAVSGGPDSLALLHAVVSWRDGFALECPPIFAATVDHGLRTEARAEAEEVARRCAEHAVPHSMLVWLGPKPAAGIQQAAREARYRLLSDEAARVGASHLATAHHEDDQAETVLMRLVRGSGLQGLAGMAEITLRGGLRHVRPFLRMPKARLAATVAAAGWRAAEDPSNDDPRFTRTRLRRIMAPLAAEGLSTGRLATLAVRAARADAALDAQAREAYRRWVIDDAEGGAARFAAGLLTEAEEIVVRVLVSALSGCGTIRLERVERLAAALLAARAAGGGVRRSVAGSIVALDGHGRVTIMRERGRRRGCASVQSLRDGR